MEMPTANRAHFFFAPGTPAHRATAKYSFSCCEEFILASRRPADMHQWRWVSHTHKAALLFFAQEAHDAAQKGNEKADKGPAWPDFSWQTPNHRQYCWRRHLSLSLVCAMDNARTSLSYQDALTLDAQDTIMRRLALADPCAALRLLSVSTTQRALGQSHPGALKVLGGMFAVNGASAAVCDYVRASIALGGHGDSRAATLAQMQWLMMAYARLIYSSPRARTLVAPLALDTPFSSERPDFFSGTCAYVSREYVRDWYDWVTNTRSVGGTESSLSCEWEKAVGGTGRPAPGVQMGLGILAGWGVEAGRGPGSVRLNGTHFMPVAGLDDAALARLITSGGAIQRDVTPQEVAAWRAAKPPGSLPDMRNVLGCPEVAVAVERHLSSAVAERMCERGRQIEAMTPLAFPRFTDVFEARAVFAPTHVDTLLLLAVRSTTVENLLREANLWP